MAQESASVTRPRLDREQARREAERHGLIVLDPLPVGERAVLPHVIALATNPPPWWPGSREDARALGARLGGLL